MAGGLPARIDRDALERIIQRAAELQTGNRDIGDALTPDEVIALGRDVGIPEGYLRQAMLEEQTRSGSAPPSGLIDRWTGSPECAAGRVIAGTVDDLESSLLHWMAEEETLALQRHTPGRLTWEPLTDFQAHMRRAFRSGRRPFMLIKADIVTATLSPLEPGYVHVALTATARKQRSAWVGGSTAIATTGVAAAGVMVALGAFLPVALAPILLMTPLGFGVGRQYRRVPERLQLGLERILDQLERGTIRPRHEIPKRSPGVLGIIEEVRKALNP